MTPYKTLYERKCRLPVCWEEVDEQALVGPDIVEINNQVMPIIRDRLKLVTSIYKSYANVCRKQVDFQEGNMVLLKVLTMKRVIHFRNKGKLASRCK